MTSIREVIQRLLFRQGETEEGAGFSYTGYWTDLVSEWSVERKHIVRLAVERIVERSDFKPNEFRHLYHIPEIDDVAHAGSSLLALLRVIKAYDEGVNAGEDK
jgi:hypothetical protein